jgi:hypothetical protein
VVQAEALDPLEPPTSLSLPQGSRTNRTGDKWRKKFAEDGDAVRAEHRLRMELHAGEALAAQGVHRAVSAGLSAVKLE